MDKIIIFLAILVVYTMMIFNYYRVRKMILLGPDSIFPSFHKAWGNIYTERGRVEKPSFHLKDWKWKRTFLIGSIIITSFALITIPLYWEEIRWSTILVLLNIPIVLYITMIVPSFYILEKGFYYDEAFIRWEDVKEFSVSPVTVGSEAYGMFEDSVSYTQMKVFTDIKRKHSKSIYVQNAEAVEAIRSIFIENGLTEWQLNVDKEKQHS